MLLPACRGATTMSRAGERGPSGLTVPPFLTGLPEDAVGRVLDQFTPQRFPAGTLLTTAGEPADALYIIQSGAAEVFMVDPSGADRRVSRAGPGTTIGEISLLTGQPATATVYAAVDVDVLSLDREAFYRLAAEFPIIYRNVGILLSERLVRSNRHAFDGPLGQVTVLDTDGAPPELGYALACSIAWHTRQTVVLVAVGAPEALGALQAQVASGPQSATGTASGLRAGRQEVSVGAELILATPDGPLGSGQLPAMVEDLREQYRHVLVQTPGGHLPSLAAANRVRLEQPQSARPERPVTNAALLPVIRAWDARSRLPRPDSAGILSVPPLEETDLLALRSGLLPPTTPAGRCLGWMARRLTGSTVGLALGAGGVKGYAHVGVLQALERLGIVPDYVAGTSIGSAVAALHAFGYRPAAAAEALDSLGMATFRLTVPTRALLSSSGLRSRLRDIAGTRRIEDADVPLAIMAADIVSREEVVFRRGLVWQAVLASAAIPGIYPPQRFGSRLLVDGGVLQPVPSNAVAAMGADIILGVKLANMPATSVAGGTVARAGGRNPSVFSVLLRAFDIMQSKITTDTARAATVVIEPAFQDALGWGDLLNFSEGRRFIELGDAAVDAARPQLAASIPWMNG
jgi:NTE family protein